MSFKSSNASVLDPLGASADHIVASTDNIVDHLFNIVESVPCRGERIEILVSVLSQTASRYQYKTQRHHKITRTQRRPEFEGNPRLDHPGRECFDPIQRHQVGPAVDPEALRKRSISKRLRIKLIYMPEIGPEGTFIELAILIAVSLPFGEGSTR